MKNVFALVLCVALALMVSNSPACVGKTIHLGIRNTVSELLLAELTALIITERTGSTVKIDKYSDSIDLYTAVKNGNVHVLFESVSNGAVVIGRPKETSFEQVKSEYKNRLNLIWLEPLSGPVKYGPVLTSESLANYTALPKLLNKLTGALVNDTYANLLKTVDGGSELKKIAKDFLKGKRLI